MRGGKFIVLRSKGLCDTVANRFGTPKTKCSALLNIDWCQLIWDSPKQVLHTEYRNDNVLAGILGSDDEKSEESADDEILAELKKKQAELKALSHQNAVMLRFLHKQAKEEMAQQDLRKKLAAADTEVRDSLKLAEFTVRQTFHQHFVWTTASYLWDV